MMPCQWIEVVSFRRFLTRIVTVSPSRQRNVGAGSEPLTVVAIRGVPVKFTGDSSISRLNSVPLSIAAEPVLVRPDCIPAARANGDKPSNTPPATRRSEEHTSELQSLNPTPYAVFSLKQQHPPPPPP